jgi:hypothetical protein
MITTPLAIIHSMLQGLKLYDSISITLIQLTTCMFTLEQVQVLTQILIMEIQLAVHMTITLIYSIFLGQQMMQGMM